MYLFALANVDAARANKLWPVVISLVRIAYNGGVYDGDGGWRDLGPPVPGTSACSMTGTGVNLFPHGKPNQSHGSIGKEGMCRLWANMNNPDFVAAALEENGVDIADRGVTHVARIHAVDWNTLNSLRVVLRAGARRAGGSPLDHMAPAGLGWPEWCPGDALAAGHHQRAHAGVDEPHQAVRPRPWQASTLLPGHM